MWQSICKQISEDLQQPFICRHPVALGGGIKDRFFKLRDERHSVFVKLSEESELVRFQAEADGLNELGRYQGLNIPQPMAVDRISGHAFLAMTFLHLEDHGNWSDAGIALAKLHQYQTNDHYGWSQDSFIGPTLQVNSWQSDWARFFAEQRIGYLLQLLAEKNISLGDIDIITERCRVLLKGHRPMASRLHGDLWHGNIGFVDRQLAIFDPAFYFGDRETDIAMSQLFGGFPHEFYQAYHQQFPLEDGYQWRKPIYTLYHLLNHALLFGESYISSCQSILRNINSN